MTCYSVQLQSNVTGVDAITKFKTIIQDLIKKLEVRPKKGILHSSHRPIHSAWRLGKIVQER